MTNIQHPSDLCTVIVTVDADPEIVTEMEKHARDGLMLFADFDGFVSGALHRSADGGRLVQYLQWRSEADHRTCMNDPRWDTFGSTQRFMERIASGEARIDVRVYGVVAASSE